MEMGARLSTLVFLTDRARVLILHAWMRIHCQADTRIVKPGSKRQNPAPPPHASLGLAVTISIRVPENPGIINSTVLSYWAIWFPYDAVFRSLIPEDAVYYFKTSSHRLSPPTLLFASPSICP